MGAAVKQLLHGYNSHADALLVSVVRPVSAETGALAPAAMPNPLRRLRLRDRSACCCGSLNYRAAKQTREVSPRLRAASRSLHRSRRRFFHSGPVAHRSANLAGRDAVGALN
ncbi:hypothetical protein MMMB2_0237 [Mycobacterium marinum MB2]|nr:hypothetical protein MMMB2_0237 [Mycobacterium marinum MB2]